MGDWVRTRRGLLGAAAGALAAFGAGTRADAAQPSTALLDGPHAPSEHAGSVGDFFIDTATHGLYGPKTAHGWGRPFSLVSKAGSVGAPGPQGASGPAGARGPSGANGYGVLHGAGAPEASLGADNDFYIDTDTTQLYGPKAGGVWGSPVALTASDAARSLALTIALGG